MRNFLRTYRKKTELSIDNISFLLSMPDSTYLSRCERGKRKPTLEIILTYQIIFQASTDNLFEEQTRRTLNKISENIIPLIEYLSKQKKTKRGKERIAFLTLLKEIIEEKLNEEKKKNNSNLS
jgi:transcriptional regulator with XRE-family HTH domain